MTLSYCDAVNAKPFGSSGLPPPIGWSKHIDKDTGLAFFYNVTSGLTTWDLPPSGNSVVLQQQQQHRHQHQKHLDGPHTGSSPWEKRASGKPELEPLERISRPGVKKGLASSRRRRHDGQSQTLSSGSWQLLGSEDGKAVVEKAATGSENSHSNSAKANAGERAASIQQGLTRGEATQSNSGSPTSSSRSCGSSGSVSSWEQQDGGEEVKVEEEERRGRPKSFAASNGTRNSWRARRSRGDSVVAVDTATSPLPPGDVGGSSSRGVMSPLALSPPPSPPRSQSRLAWEAGRKDYLAMVREFTQHRPYRERSKEHPPRCVLCRKRAAALILFPCEHLCLCTTCQEEHVISEDVRKKRAWNQCPLCCGDIKRIIPFLDGTEASQYWDWVLQVKPKLPRGFTKEFKGLGTVVLEMRAKGTYVDDPAPPARWCGWTWRWRWRWRRR